MQVHGPHGPNGISPIYPRREVSPVQPNQPAPLEMPQDEIQISPEAQALAEVSQAQQIRQMRIEQIKHMIAQGVYDTPERLAIAVDKLLDHLRELARAQKLQG